MNGRERLTATLNHQQPDRVCVDFGATPVTGIHAAAVHRLRRAVVGETDHAVKVIEPYQMLGEIDDELRAALGIDTVGRAPRHNLFGVEQRDWKPFTFFDGTNMLIPQALSLTVEEGSGDLLTYPQGDLAAPASGRMPKGGYFFDSIVRQEPIDESKLDPADNAEEFGPLDEAELAHFREAAAWLDARRESGGVLVAPGTAFGDIGLVPAPFLKHPKGIRDVAEWYKSLVKRKDYVRAVFERQCEFAEQNLRTLMELLGDRVQVVMISGTDFGMQTGPMMSVRTYRELFKPFHMRVNKVIHENSNWKTFTHSCGGIYPLIPEFIEAGFDILNPVQCSATDMEAPRLKKEFGDDIVFWGGGVNTQQTMAFGTPDEVYQEVRERIDIFNDGGGFVFNAIHNVQGNTSTENMLAMFRAIADSAK